MNSNRPDNQLSEPLWEINILFKILTNQTNKLLYCSLIDSYKLYIFIALSIYVHYYKHANSLQALPTLSVV